MNTFTENSDGKKAQPLSYLFEGRQVEIRPDAQANAGALLTDAVFIDGQPLAIRRMGSGSYRSAIDFYKTFSTLRDTANAAVRALGGRQVPPLQQEPARLGYLPTGLPDLTNPGEAPRRRKNIKDMGPDELDLFVRALLKLKNNTDDYDAFVQVHCDAFAFHGWGAHSNALLPWHRLLIYHFESLLRAQAGFENVTVPYWDWTQPIRPGELPYTNEFMGGGGGEEEVIANAAIVDTGRFAYHTGNWSVFRPPQSGFPPIPGPQLRRLVEEKLFGMTLIESTQLERVANISRFVRERNTGFGYQLNAQLHNPVHDTLSGDMVANESPRDPIFWLHHCMLDKVWADWQNRYPVPHYLNDPEDHPHIDPNRDPLEPWLSDLGRAITINELIDYKRLYTWFCRSKAIRYDVRNDMNG